MAANLGKLGFPEVGLWVINVRSVFFVFASWAGCLGSYCNVSWMGFDP